LAIATLLDARRREAEISAFLTCRRMPYSACGAIGRRPSAPRSRHNIAVCDVSILMAGSLERLPAATSQD
jgi:hypothetical protein